MFLSVSRCSFPGQGNCPPLTSSFWKSGSWSHLGLCNLIWGWWNIGQQRKFYEHSVQKLIQKQMLQKPEGFWQPVLYFLVTGVTGGKSWSNSGLNRVNAATQAPDSFSGAVKQQYRQKCPLPSYHTPGLAIGQWMADTWYKSHLSVRWIQCTMIPTQKVRLRLHLRL